MFILQMSKSQKPMPNFTENYRKKQHSSSFQGSPLSSPSYTVTVSYRSFHLNQIPVDCIPVYLCTRPIKQILIIIPLLYSK